MSIKCFVVMGNDYPAGVFASEQAADNFILFQRWWNMVNASGARIHWRWYEFSLETEFVPTTLKIGQSKKLMETMSDDLKREWWYWYSKEYGRSGAAAGAASEFRQNVETELRVRGVDIETLRSAYTSVANLGPGLTIPRT